MTLGQVAIRDCLDLSCLITYQKLNAEDRIPDTNEESASLLSSGLMYFLYACREVFGQFIKLIGYFTRIGNYSPTYLQIT